MDREVLRDDQWARLEPFVPGGRKGRRGPRSDARRRFFNALLWLARSGARFHQHWNAEKANLPMSNEVRAVIEAHLKTVPIAHHPL